MKDKERTQWMQSRRKSGSRKHSLTKQWYKGKACRIAFALLGIITIYFYISGVSYSKSLAEKNNLATLISTDEQSGMTYEAAKASKERNDKSDKPLDFVNWNQEDSQSVSVTDLKSGEKASVLSVYGRTNFLFPESAALDTASTNSCLISSQLAFLLFGGSDVAGLKVNYGQKQYIITGVVKNQEPFLVREADGTEAAPLDRTTIKTEKGTDPQYMASLYKNQYGDGQIIDYGILGAIAKGLSLVLPVALGIVLLVMIWSYARGSKDSKKEQLIWYGIFILVAFIFLWLLVRQLKIPQNMIPDRWSNFQFWSDYWKNEKLILSTLVTAPKGILDLPYMNDFYHALTHLICSIAGAAGMAVLYGRIRLKSDRSDRVIHPTAQHQTQ